MPEEAANQGTGFLYNETLFVVDNQKGELYIYKLPLGWSLESGVNAELRKPTRELDLADFLTCVEGKGASGKSELNGSEEIRGNTSGGSNACKYREGGL